MSYQVFKRKAWRKVDGEFVPNSRATKTHVCYCETEAEARNICGDGPANKALAASKEYRNLPFYEFTSA